MCFLGVLFPNAPPVDTANRHAMAVVALGGKAEAASFYAPMTAVSNASESTVGDAIVVVCAASTAQSADRLPADVNSTCSLHVLAAPSVPSDSNEQDVLLDELLSLLREKHSSLAAPHQGCRR